MLMVSFLIVVGEGFSFTVKKSSRTLKNKPVLDRAVDEIFPQLIN